MRGQGGVYMELRISLWFQLGLGVVLLVTGGIFALKRATIEDGIRKISLRMPRVTREPTRVPARMLLIVYPVVMILVGYSLIFEMR